MGNTLCCTNQQMQPDLADDVIPIELPSSGKKRQSKQESSSSMSSGFCSNDYSTSSFNGRGGVIKTKKNMRTSYNGNKGGASSLVGPKN